MASIEKTLLIEASAASVWDAVRDFGALHRRLVPGFVRDTKLEGDARIVSFGNGTVARELLVDCDDSRRRLVYAVVNERIQHYNAVVQIEADGADRARLTWTIDLLPNSAAPYIEGQMQQACAVMKETLERNAK